jgi:hypothetical protein
MKILSIFHVNIRSHTAEQWWSLELLDTMAMGPNIYFVEHYHLPTKYDTIFCRTSKMIVP